MKTPCPIMADLMAYVLDDVSAKRSEALRAHLEACEACRAEAAAHTAVRDDLRAALLADAQAPDALTPERLAAVLATQPVKTPRRKKAARRRWRIPWRILGGMAAALVLFLLIAPLFMTAGKKFAGAALALDYDEDAPALLADSAVPASMETEVLRQKRSAASEGIRYHERTRYLESDNDGSARPGRDSSVQEKPMPPAAPAGAYRSDVVSRIEPKPSTAAPASLPPPANIAGGETFSPYSPPPPAAEPEMVAVDISYPKPAFTGTPKDINALTAGRAAAGGEKESGLRAADPLSRAGGYAGDERDAGGDIRGEPEVTRERMRVELAPAYARAQAPAQEMYDTVTGGGRNSGLAMKGESDKSEAWQEQDGRSQVGQQRGADASAGTTAGYAVVVETKSPVILKGIAADKAKDAKDNAPALNTEAWDAEDIAVDTSPLDAPLQAPLAGGRQGGGGAGIPARIAGDRPVGGTALALPSRPGLSRGAVREDAKAAAAGEANEWGLAEGERADYSGMARDRDARMAEVTDAWVTAKKYELEKADGDEGWKSRGQLGMNMIQEEALALPAEQAVSRSGRADDVTKKESVAALAGKLLAQEKQHATRTQAKVANDELSKEDAEPVAEPVKVAIRRRKSPDDADRKETEEGLADADKAPLVPAMSARFISLYDALKLVCDMTGTKPLIEDGRVAVVPQEWPDAEPVSQATLKKLRDITIPEVSFRPPATLADAVDFFAQASRDYDSPETPVAQRGLRFSLNLDAPPEPPPKKPPPVAPVPHVNPFVKTAAQPLSTFAIGTDTASYTLARQSIGNGMLPDPSVVRVEEFVNALDYKDAAPERTTFRIIAEGAPTPFGRDTRLVRLAIKGRRLGREEQRPANLVFLVDASGSMAQPDRMGAIRLALAQLLDGLRPEDHLQIITFNEKARVVQTRVSAAQRQEILANFNRVQATGPTSLQDGMAMAYQEAVAAFQPGAENRVILITDGVANLGSAEASDILAQIDDCRRQGIRLSVFGVGRGTYNDTLLQQLANKGDGTYRFLDSPEAITAAFVNDLSATLYTIASDAKVQVEWFPHAVEEYRQLGYEARALTAQQFRDDTVVAGQIGSGQAASALYEISLARTARALPPDAELGIVRIRFRPAEGGAVQEHSRPITRADLADAFAKARPEFQFAAVAAGFAERLRRSPYAPPQGYAELANLIRPAAQQLYLDTRFAELVHLLDAAAAIAR
ncbi:MAG: von Willebrand factor type A domain-containing protein [Kiritimatiellaeota bacterium]|nr:von Willebrand factor type A domain-containing protein [Kiritimatiellota bacterium]